MKSVCTEEREEDAEDGLVFEGELPSHYRVDAQKYLPILRGGEVNRTTKKDGNEDGGRRGHNLESVGVEGKFRCRGTMGGNVSPLPR